MKGFFGDIYDFNHDAELDVVERAADFTMFSLLMDATDEGRTELEMAGIDPEELEIMSADERRKVLEEAGLVPDDYDF